MAIASNLRLPSCILALSTPVQMVATLKQQWCTKQSKTKTRVNYSMHESIRSTTKRTNNFKKLIFSSFPRHVSQHSVLKNCKPWDKQFSVPGLFWNILTKIPEQLTKGLYSVCYFMYRKVQILQLLSEWEDYVPFSTLYAVHTVGLMDIEAMLETSSHNVLAFKWSYNDSSICRVIDW